MNKKYGFTLIELLTVVLILGILTAIALPQYRKSIQRAEAANALINLKTAFDAAKRYYSFHSQWPSSFQGLDVQIPDMDPTTGNAGEFQYSLNDTNKATSACRLINNTANNSYCLTAYYVKGDNRDTYTCQYSNSKYQSLCESMCPSSSSGECTIE